MSRSVLVLAFLFSAASATDLWMVTSDTLIQVAPTPDYVKKIETTIYKDTNEPNTTYIICIATLSTLSQSGQLHIEKRKVVVGESGTSPPELITLVQFPNEKIYRDVDITVNGNNCIFAALTSPNTVFVGNGVSGFSNFGLAGSIRTQIEIVHDSTATKYFYMDDNNLYMPNPPFDTGLLPQNHSMDAVAFGNGDIAVAAALGPDFYILVDASDRLPTLPLEDPGVNPSLIAFDDDSLFLCGETVYGIGCAFGDSAGRFQPRSNTIPVITYRMPVISVLNDTMKYAAMTMLVNNGTSTSYELIIVDCNLRLVFTRALTKNNVTAVHSSAMDSYIFLVYADNIGVKMDMVYFGEASPPVVTTPVVEPVSVPITDQGPFMNQPIIEPVSGPIPDKSPIESPTSNTNSSLVEESDPTILGPAISIPIAAAVTTGVILLVYFLTKKKQTEKRSSQSSESEENPTKAIPLPAVTADKTQPTLPTKIDPNYETVEFTGNNRQYTGDVTPSEITSSSESSNDPTTSSESSESEDIPPASTPAEIERRLRIPYSSLVFGKKIGAGSFGKVYLGEWSGAEVAIKVNNLIADAPTFLAEAKLTLAIAPHPNLVRTYGVSLDGPNPCIVLEYCGGGSLDRLVFQHGRTVSTAQRKELALKIAYGLLHLHNNNIVHRDLAARNILLTKDGQPKISDFGMSRIVKSRAAEGKTKNSVGPVRWMAPESLQDLSYSTKSDVWTYGILVFEIVSSEEPHAYDDQLIVAARIRDEGYTPHIPNSCDPTLRHVMEMCWRFDPAQRPTMEEIADYIRNH